MSEDDVIKICRHAQSVWPGETEIKTGDDNGRYINLFVRSNDAIETWSRIRWTYVDSKLQGSELARSSIITVTGVRGWDDYLLLHHFDRSEKLDTLDSTKPADERDT